MTTLKLTYDVARTSPEDHQFADQYQVHVTRSDGKPIHPQEVHAALRISLEVSATHLEQMKQRAPLKLVK